jgi:signal peptidase I
LKAKSRAKSWLSLIVAVSFAVPALLSIFGVISIRAVLSDSMSPKINVGDLVVSANWQTPLQGDVAIYHQRNLAGSIQQDVVHRVVTISEQGEYQFKGDNNASIDALSVPKSDIVGTIFLKVPAIGSLLNAAGIFSLILLIGGIYLLIYGLKSIRKHQSGSE